MDDYNWFQRALRPVINWIVEKVFPHHCFYGHEYLSHLDRLEADDRSAVMSCAMYIQSKMRDLDADQATITMEGVTHNNLPVGSFRLTLDRLDEGEGETQ